MVFNLERLPFGAGTDVVFVRTFFFFAKFALRRVKFKRDTVIRAGALIRVRKTSDFRFYFARFRGRSPI